MVTMQRGHEQVAWAWWMHKRAHSCVHMQWMRPPRCDTPNVHYSTLNCTWCLHRSMLLQRCCCCCCPPADSAAPVALLAMELRAPQGIL